MVKVVVLKVLVKGDNMLIKYIGTKIVKAESMIKDGKE